MRYTINLATRTHLDHQFLNRLAYCAISLLLVLAIWNVGRVSSNMGDISRLNAAVAAVEGKLAAKPAGISEAEFNRQKSHIRFYNEVIDHKSTNWLNTLECFENATPEGISLASLTVGKMAGEWKLEGRARTFKAVQRYLEALEASKNFSNVLLLSHQKITAGVTSKGIQFSISCKVVN